MREQALATKGATPEPSTIKDAPSWPAYAPIEEWGRISGLSRRVTYDLLGTGELRAIKRSRSTLVDVQHGLAYLRSLPAAKIRAPRKAAATEVSA